MMNQLFVKRSELKFYINPLDAVALASRLKHVIQSDRHSAVNNGYTVRSLYFDSADDRCLDEKQGGFLNRKKYRLRIYNSSDCNAKFEVKSKQNNQISKQSTSIRRESAEAIILGDHRELLQYNDPILEQVYCTFVAQQFQPKVIVEYQRDAYIFDPFNVRITIDKHIRCSTSNLSIFADNLHLLPVIQSGNFVLEVKFDQVLPDFIRNLLQLPRFEQMAISKYVLSRRFFKTHQWEDA